MKNKNNTKLLLITNMYPLRNNPYKGVFVKNQFIYLKNNYNIKTSILYPNIDTSNLIGSLSAYIYLFLKSIKYFFKKFNVIHVHFFYYHFLIAYLYKLFWPNTKLIVTFHGTDYNFLIKNNFISNLYLKMAKKIDHIIAVGNEQLENINKIIGTNIKSTSLSAGIDSNRFFKINKEKKYDFIFIGNLDKIKGIDILIEAIINYNLNYNFCIVGKGILYPNIKRIADINNNIDLINGVDQKEIPTLLNKSRFFVLPSRRDAFGLVVTEAMYCGLPVIVSNASGLKQQVINSYNGYVIEEISSMRLANVLKKCMNMNTEDYKNMVNNALQSNRKHDLKNVCSTLYKIYKD